MELADRDKTNVGEGTICVPLDDATDASKIAYYALKIARLFPIP